MANLLETSRQMHTFVGGMDFGHTVRRRVLFCVLFLITMPDGGDTEDHDAYLDNTEENNEARVIFVIQLIVLILFAYKGWNAVFGSRSVQADPGSQWPNQFPFLPSYDMAINELSAIQHSISNTTTENVTIGNGVILEIGNLCVTTSAENQRNV
ncbi:uncharacterized protein LOC144662640 isoform X2 [Oculina patagonica]